MKKLALFCLLISAPLFASEELSPQQAVENYFGFFNNEDRASLRVLGTCGQGQGDKLSM